METNHQPSDQGDGSKSCYRSISVFFPCYNEQDNIVRAFEQALSALEELGVDFEVIIVNDGSSDSTGQIVDKIAQSSTRVKVIHHPKNRGYGAALHSGFKEASKELVFYTDGDGQFDIKELPGLMPLIGEYDIVSCYRLNRQDNLLRKINGWCWTKLVRLFFGIKIKDINCAFKLYRRNIFDKIVLVSTGALIDTEILAKATRMGCRITQTGVHHYPRMAGSSTGANLRVILCAFRELFKLHRQIRGQ